VRAKDESGNYGWSQVPMMKIVDHEFTPPPKDFYYASEVPPTLDLSTPQTIYLDVPQGGTVTAALIKLTGGSDAPRDQTIKVGDREACKYNGKFT
jgi:hypothetical protein